MATVFPTQLDPGVAALIGALIGAGSSVVVQVIAAIISARHEARSFQRAFRKEVIGSVTDAYEYTLNVLFNMKRGNPPDPATYGNVFAQISLRGSDEVNELMNEFHSLAPAARADFDVSRVINAMQNHVKQLEREVR